MRGLAVLAFVSLAIVSWGTYGPVLHEGQTRLGDGEQLGRMRPLICVGVAYFLIAVLVPIFKIKNEEQANWSTAGLIWSLLAGALGATGAVGIMFAFIFGGTPVFVMPLVFGFAPVINTAVSMLMSRTIKNASVAFYLGVMIVAIGGAGVIFFKPTMPSAHPPGNSTTDGSLSKSQLVAESETSHLTIVIVSVGLAAFCWGSYGPVLHLGQSKMGGSRWRPFMMLGLAYFVIAVAAPLVLSEFLPPDPGQWNLSGSVWSLIAGSLGAIGALGVIYAFDSGGSPIFVMPLVFGGAPVINTISTTFANRLAGELTYPFYISLFLVIVGSITVLVCAPHGKTPSSEKPPKLIY